MNPMEERKKVKKNEKKKKKKKKGTIFITNNINELSLLLCKK